MITFSKPLSPLPFLALTFASALVTGCVSETQSVVPTPPAQMVEKVAETPITFEAASGQSAEAFEGTFMVPENRSDPDSRMLTLHYVRFPATGLATGTKKSSPIIYLAGGPGGSGIQTAKYWRLPLFLAMREFGDVIALDQRGTGASDDMPKCTSSEIIDVTHRISDAGFVKMHQNALKECLKFWEDEKIDAHGYTTLENASDLDALRIHLGAEKISLWGISYGSHLALAALKQMEDRIDKVIIASAEGLAQTIKQPARTDLYFARLQDAINTQPKAKAQYPDINAMMRRVHASLDTTPLMLDVPQKEGAPVQYLLQRRDMQQIASAMISDPSRAKMLLQIYSQLDQGNTAPIASLMARFYTPNEGISFEAMGTLTDIASGIGTQHRKMIETQAKTSLLDVYLNDTLAFVDVDPSLDLGDDFREKPVSDIPLLLLTGTLDGRTYIKSQSEAVSSMPNAQKVRVTNAGHNLFMLSATEVRPGVLSAMQGFMRGENVDGREVIANLPEF